jgi:small subunit ribosomal protein S15
LDKEKKGAIIGDYRRDSKDTGSSEVQVALITERMKELAQHLGKNRKDFHSQRGLLQLIGQRRSLLAYLAKKNRRRYLALIEKLGLKK